MSENKTTKYFKYAIGEIVLVVIGILIALQINNWNTNQQDRKKEHKYLLNVQTDLESQIKEIEDQISYETRILKNTKFIMDRFNSTNTFIVDSALVVSANYLGDRRTFKTTNSTYTQLVNSGEMKLIMDEKFRNDLAIYQQNMEQLKNIVLLNNSHFVDDNAAIKVREMLPIFWPNPQNHDSRIGKRLPYEGNISVEKLNQMIHVSQTILKDKKTLMEFINLTTTRYGHAWYHIQLMQNKKVETRKLLDELQNLIKEQA